MRLLLLIILFGFISNFAAAKEEADDMFITNHFLTLKTENKTKSFSIMYHSNME